MDVVMEPALWGTLPKELLYLVFSRLPVSGISKLRLLSKDWKKDIETRDSDFSRILEETVYPSMFGLICRKDKEKLDGFCVRVFDGRSDRWQNFPIDAADSDEVIPVGAADGGLICLVSVTSQNPLFIIVMNPLTGKKVELPCLLGMDDILTPVPPAYDGVLPKIRPTMVQLIMDSQKQHYKVFVVGYVIKGRRHPFAQVYDSRVKEWTIVGSGQRSWDRISGCEYSWENERGEHRSGMRCGPCVYDSAEGRLRYFSCQNGGVGHGIFEVLNNRLFVLHKEVCLPPKYHI